MLFHRFYKNEGTCNIVIIILKRLVYALSNRLVACKMYNCIYFIFTKYLVKRCTVKHVCLIELNALTCNLLYPLDRLHTGVVEIVKSHYLVTSIKQLNAGMTSDIACTTCYQNSHNILLYWITAFPPQSDNI